MLMNAMPFTMLSVFYILATIFVAVVVCKIKNSVSDHAIRMNRFTK